MEIFGEILDRVDKLEKEVIRLTSLIKKLKQEKKHDNRKKESTNVGRDEVHRSRTIEICGKPYDKESRAEVRAKYRKVYGSEG